MPCRAEDKDASSRQQALGVDPLDVAGRGLLREQKARDDVHHAARHEDNIGDHTDLRDQTHWRKGQCIGHAHGEAHSGTAAQFLYDLGDVHRCANHATQQVAPELNNQKRVDSRLRFPAEGNLRQETPAAHARLHAAVVALHRSCIEGPNHQVRCVGGARDKEEDHRRGRQAGDGHGVGHGEQPGADHSGERCHSAVPDAQGLPIAPVLELVDTRAGVPAADVQGARVFWLSHRGLAICRDETGGEHHEEACQRQAQAHGAHRGLDHSPSSRLLCRPLQGGPLRLRGGQRRSSGRARLRPAGAVVGASPRGDMHLREGMCWPSFAGSCCGLLLQGAHLCHEASSLQGNLLCEGASRDVCGLHSDLGYVASRLHGLALQLMPLLEQNCGFLAEGVEDVALCAAQVSKSATVPREPKLRVIGDERQDVQAHCLLGELGCVRHQPRH
mmetsp:Transcript_35364/g.97840  ORF Transcript_35364/g.97840 Transcript_35364/m.97840 type:complete len:444 (+) Transcript_35364:794-2125(+)